MVDLHSYNYPSATRTNLPTDQTERFMEPEDYEDQGFRPEPMDNSAHPTLHWNRKPLEEFQHGPLYIQEKIHPAVLIQSALKEQGKQIDLFSQFNGLPEEANYDWYLFDGDWQNRLIHGDAKRVMASLAQREGLAGQVQTIYMDPPYNIKFNANFQLRTDETEVSDSGDTMPHDTLAVKAFRDAYEGNIHTFLDNLHHQLVLARELLADTGSCFLQIGYENVHELACLMNEVFGKENHLSTIPYFTGTNQSGNFLPQIGNWILWFAKDRTQAKYHQLYQQLSREEKLIHMSSYAMCELPDGTYRNLTNEEKKDLEVLPEGTRLFTTMRTTSKGTSTTGRSDPFTWQGNTYLCPGEQWRVSHEGLQKLADANRLISTNGETLRWKKYEDEIPGRYINAAWTDIGSPQDKRYVVQSPDTTIERCILMTSDPGDLVLDPTCGAGTTAYLAEKWGRRWLTMDTSRVAIAVARQRLATSKFDYYLLQDSESGAKREAELPGAQPITPSGTRDVSKEFIYPRMLRVSAATLAYGIEKYIYIVDQPERNPQKTRVCSPFTVESDTRPQTISTDEDTAAAAQASPTREQILEALPVAGVKYRNDHWTVTDLEPYPGREGITHTATLREKNSKKTLKAAIYIAPEDVTVGPNQIRRAAREIPNMVPQRDSLLVISFGYDPGATLEEYHQMGSIQVLRAEADRDLMIEGLKHSPTDHSFVIIGEPDVDLKQAPNGQLELEVRGVDTYDPKLNSIRSSEPQDIHCILTDTDFDGFSFKVRRINFPNQTKDKQLERFKKDLQRSIDNSKWNRLLSTTTIPFDTPTEGRIAVKVIDKSGMETMTVITVPA